MNSILDLLLMLTQYITVCVYQIKSKRKGESKMMTSRHMKSTKSKIYIQIPF